MADDRANRDDTGERVFESTQTVGTEDTEINDLALRFEQLGISRGSHVGPDNRVMFEVPAKPDMGTTYVKDCEIKYNSCVLTSAADYDNSFRDRLNYIDIGRNLFQHGWTYIERDPEHHRKRSISRAFCVNAPHEIETVNKHDSTFKRTGNGFTCYIIEDTTYVAKKMRCPKLNTNLDNINFNADDEVGQNYDRLLDACTIPTYTVDSTMREQFDRSHARLIQSTIKMVIDNGVPIAGYYQYDHLIECIEHYNNKKTSTACIESMNIEFDYRAAMYLIGFTEAKLFSDDNFKFNYVFNAVPNVSRLTKDYNQFSRGEFLATLNIHQDIYAAINLRILARAGVDCIYLHGIEIAAIVENVTVGEILKAIQYLRSSIMYTAKLLGCETEHDIAYCQGLHTAWHLHAHTDEGGWIRKVHNYVRYPCSHGYLKCDPLNATLKNVMIGSWLEERGKIILDKYLCYAYCSTLADPGMTLNGYPLPTIALRSDFGDRTGIVTFDQFKAAIINNDQSGISSQCKASDFDIIAITFRTWLVNLKYLYATCQGLSCGSSDPEKTIQNKVMNMPQKHFARKASVMPYSWIEVSGIAMYRHMSCALRPVYTIFNCGVLTLFEGIANVGYLKEFYKRHGSMLPDERVVFRLDQHSPRYSGIHYMLSSAYDPKDGLAGAKYLDHHSNGEMNPIELKIINAHNDWQSCTHMRWTLPHTTIPHPCEGVVFMDDVLVRYIHTAKSGMMPSIYSIQQDGVRTVIYARVLENKYNDIGKAKKCTTYINEGLWNLIRRASGLTPLQQGEHEASQIIWPNQENSYQDRPMTQEEVKAIDGPITTARIDNRRLLRAANYTRQDQQIEIENINRTARDNRVRDAISMGRANITTEYRAGDRRVREDPQQRIAIDTAVTPIDTQSSTASTTNTTTDNVQHAYVPNPVFAAHDNTRMATMPAATFASTPSNTSDIFNVRPTSYTPYKGGSVCMSQLEQRSDTLPTSLPSHTQQAPHFVSSPMRSFTHTEHHSSPSNWPVSPLVLNNIIDKARIVLDKHRLDMHDNENKNVKMLKGYLSDIVRGINTNDFGELLIKHKTNGINDFAKFLAGSNFDRLKIDELDSLKDMGHRELVERFNQVAKQLRYNLRLPRGQSHSS